MVCICEEPNDKKKEGKKEAIVDWSQEHIEVKCSVEHEWSLCCRRSISANNEPASKLAQKEPLTFLCLCAIPLRASCDH